jgi:hypothetical protein
VRRELSYALDWARQEPSNESPWAYVRGLMRVKPGEVETGEVTSPGSQQLEEGGWRFSEYPELEAQLLAVRDEVRTGYTSAYLSFSFRFT